MAKIHFRDDTVESYEHVKIMPNGWIKAYNDTTVDSSGINPVNPNHHPQERITFVEGHVEYRNSYNS